MIDIKEKLQVDISEEGLEFLTLNNGVVETTEHFDDSHEQKELFHEFSLVQLALESGRVKVSEDGKTAQITITIPVRLNCGCSSIRSQISKIITDIDK
jgi:hypothetical protein